MTQKKIEEVLNSLDGCTPAATPDFFYTRLTARMANELGASEVIPQRNWFLKPAFALAALSILILLNVFVVMQNNKKDNPNVAVAGTDNIQALAADYSIADGNNYQYDYALEK
jgi:hypothetical protein